MHSLLHSLATAAPAPATNSFWMPPPGSTMAPTVDFVFMGITYVCYFFFALVVALMVIFVVRYRQKGNQVVIHEGVSEHNTPLEVTWTVVPVVIVVAIFFAGFKGYLTLATPPANSYQIDVIAKQWSWTFKYPNGAISEDLVVPVDRPVKLVLRSDDVLHSLYIPDFRVKKDVVPARYNVLWFQATTATTWEKVAGEEQLQPKEFHRLYCTEYCGKDHSRMNRRVVVLNEADFTAWEDQQAKWLINIPDAELYFRAGPILYARCSSCHSLDGTSGVGPSWGPYNGMPNVWDRVSKGLSKIDGKSIADFIGPGKEFEDPKDYIRNSILAPNKHIVDGFAPGMPTFQGQLDDRGIDALIGFMQHLSEFDSKGKWKNAAAK